MRTFKPLILLPFAFILAAAVPHAQAPAAAPFALTVESIMRGPDLVGYPPENLRWSADSRTPYFDWRRP